MLKCLFYSKLLAHALILALSNSNVNCSCCKVFLVIPNSLWNEVIVDCAKRMSKVRETREFITSKLRQNDLIMIQGSNFMPLSRVLATPSCHQILRHPSTCRHQFSDQEADAYGIIDGRGSTNWTGAAGRRWRQTLASVDIGVCRQICNL